jgi:ribosomal protein S18 acetylase RimI-like enzyme
MIPPDQQTPGYQIEPLLAADLPAALQLWRQTEGLVLNESDTPSQLGTYLQRNPGLSRVARHQGRLVAAVLCGHDGRRGSLHHLAVDPDHRQRGLGRSLVQSCLAALEQVGILKCNLFLLAGNDGGSQFWSSQGWLPRPDLVVLQRHCGPTRLAASPAAPPDQQT